MKVEFDFPPFRFSKIASRATCWATEKGQEDSARYWQTGAYAIREDGTEDELMFVDGVLYVVYDSGEYVLFDQEKYPSVCGYSANRSVTVHKNGRMVYIGSRGALKYDGLADSVSAALHGLSIVPGSYESSIPAMRLDEDFWQFCRRLGGYRDFNQVEEEVETVYYKYLFSALCDRQEVTPEEFAALCREAEEAEQAAMASEAAE